MKTSELIKRINKLSYDHSLIIRKYAENNVIGLYELDLNREIMRVDSYMIEIVYPDKFMIDSTLSNAYELMFEYAKTPLEEREEEKKYWLKLPKQFSLIEPNYLCRIKTVTLYKNTFDYRYMFVDEPDEKAEFTQKEIDAMPFDTKFFIKVEVK